MRTSVKIVLTCALLLVFLLCLVPACAKPAPAPTPAPAPAPPPVTVTVTPTAPGKPPVTVTITPTAPAPKPEPAPAKPIEWTIHWWGGQSAIMRPLEWWANQMETRSDGRFKAEIVYGGVLGTSKEQIDNIKVGLFDMGHIVAHYIPGKVPLVNGKNLPCVPPGELKQVGQWAMAVHQHPELVKEMEEWNAVYIVDTFLPVYNLRGTTAIRTVEDFDGVKITMSGLASDLFGQFGAVGVTMPGTEIMQAMSSGLVDLSYGADYAADAYRRYEVSDYYIYGLNVGTASDACIANKDSWDALPEDIKQIARDLRVEIIDQFVSEYNIAHISWLQHAAEWNLEFIEFPSGERAKLIERAEGIWEKWATDLDAEGEPGWEVLDHMLDKSREFGGLK